MPALVVNNPVLGIKHNKGYFIYGLVDPRTNLIAYIGKTVYGLSRPFSHTSPATFRDEPNSPKTNWLKHLLNLNLLPTVTLLFTLDLSINKKEANIILYDKEQELIKKYKNNGYNLKNWTDGGPGATGRIVSKELRAKMSVSAKSRPLPTALIENQKPKVCPLVSHRRRQLKARLRDRSIPGARQAYVDSKSKKLIKINPETNERIPVLGMRPAAREIGGKCSKTGIRSAIKSKSLYYGFYWENA